MFLKKIDIIATFSMEEHESLWQALDLKKRDTILEGGRHIEHEEGARRQQNSVQLLAMLSVLDEKHGQV